MKAEEGSSPKLVPVRVLILDDKGMESGKIKELVQSLRETFDSVSIQTGTHIKTPDPEITDDPSEIYRILKEEEDLPDLIFCDLNLSKKGEGEKVAMRIAEQHYPTDMMLYSYGTVLGKGTEIRSRYGIVLTANEQKIKGYTEWLVWRTITKLSDPEYVRGLILSRATDTELIIDECLTDLFKVPDEHRQHFKMGVLRSEGNGPIQKYKVLRLSMEDIGLVGKVGSGEDHTLNKLLDIIKKRNLVAHGRAESDLRGGLVIQNRIDPSSSKNPDKNLDYQEKLPRDVIKKYFYNCYKEDGELLEIRKKIKGLIKTI